VIEPMEAPSPAQVRQQHLRASPQHRRRGNRYFELAATAVRRTADSLSTRSLANIIVGIFALVSAGTMILTPPFQSPDSQVHFDRTVGISYGELIGSTSGRLAGGYLPAGLSQVANAFSPLPTEPSVKTSARAYALANTAPWNGPRVFQPFPATTTRNPILYMPGAIAIAISRLFSNRILVAYYMVELTNLLLFLVMIWWSIRQFHYTLAVPICIFTLLPMVVFLASSVNPDGLLIGLSIVYAAAIFQLFQRSTTQRHTATTTTGVTRFIRRLIPSGLGRYDAIAWASLALISFDKPPYAALGLILGISYLRQHDYPSYVKTVLLGIGSIAVIELAWLALGSRAGRVPVVTGSQNVSASRQGQYVIHHLDSLAPLLFNTIKADAGFYTRSGIGILGWLDTPLPSWSYIGAAILIIASVIGLMATTRPQPLLLVVAGVAIVAAALLTFLTLYADWTPVGAKTVLGIQGRYLLPLFPILVACIGLSPRNSRSLRLPGLIGVLVMGMGCEVTMTIVLLTRYWAAG